MFTTSFVADQLYVYRLLIDRVIDGDTVEGTLYLGFDIKWEKRRFRLYGINAPEMRGTTKEAGEAARAYLTDLIIKYRAADQKLYVRSHKMGLDPEMGVYNRYVVELFGVDASGLVNFNQKMVEAGHAIAQAYGEHGQLCGHRPAYHVPDDDEPNCPDCFAPENNCRCAPGEG